MRKTGNITTTAAAATTKQPQQKESKAQRIINLVEKIATMKGGGGSSSSNNNKKEGYYIDLSELYSASKSLANTLEGLARQEGVRASALHGGIRIKDGKLKERKI